MPARPDSRRWTVASVSGDGAYDTKGCHEAIAQRGAQAIILTRKNAKPSLVQVGGAFVEEENGSIVGYVILDIEIGEVEALFVVPECQGWGIAHRLLSTVEKTALKSGLARLFLLSSLAD